MATAGESQRGEKLGFWDLCCDGFLLFLGGLLFVFSRVFLVFSLGFFLWFSCVVGCFPMVFYGLLVFH